MNIFCKETQEHLQSIQSQVEAGVLPKVSAHTLSISMIVLDWSTYLQQELFMVPCHTQQILVKFNASLLVQLQPPSTNKILITPELWLQENAQSAADGEKATGTGTKRELSTSETAQGPLDLNIKVRQG